MLVSGSRSALERLRYRRAPEGVNPGW